MTEINMRNASFDLHRKGFMKNQEKLVDVVYNTAILEKERRKQYTYLAVNLKTFEQYILGCKSFQMKKEHLLEFHDKIKRHIEDNSKNLTTRNEKEKLLLMKLFEEILPNSGMNFRKQQMDLSLKILEGLQNRKISLCEAEVGTGKTHAYILASVVHNLFKGHKQSTVIATSTIALQKAILNEYLPQISKVLMQNEVIDKPLKYIVRKGKSHYICENKLKVLVNIMSKNHSDDLKLSDLRELMYDQRQIELDELPFKNYIKKRICVTGCNKKCGHKDKCRYREFLIESIKCDYDFQILNHNYLMADIITKKDISKALLPHFGQVIIDEAHKLPDTIRDMYGVKIYADEIPRIISEIASKQKISVGKYKTILEMNKTLFIDINKKSNTKIEIDKFMQVRINKIVSILKKAELDLIKGSYSSNENLRNQIKRVIMKFDNLVNNSENIMWSNFENNKITLSYLSVGIRDKINEDFWKTNIPTVMTSGTISVNGDFSHIEDKLGLENQVSRIERSSTSSPFDYKKQGILYLPKNMPFPRTDNDEYNKIITEEITNLIKVTHGHTLILFTSYKMMDKVFHEISNKNLPYPMFMMGRGKLNVIDDFRNSKNGVLFASDAAGEGIDLQGDILSILIVVRLPFPIPNAVSEYEISQKGCFEEYLSSDIVPQMIIKLRQWIGRGIRRETDTCAFTILDPRASGRYRETILNALPDMPVTRCRTDVSQFILDNKTIDYFD